MSECKLEITKEWQKVSDANAFGIASVRNAGSNI
jgi:hypothetical protein